MMSFASIPIQVYLLPLVVSINRHSLIGKNQALYNIYKVYISRTKNGFSTLGSVRK